MRKLTFMLLFVVGWLATVVGQSPKIALSPTTITENIGVGGTKKITLKIENTGSRDLIWDFNGASVYFAKLDYANYMNSANQDRINDNVWITRADLKGIFNIKQELEFDYDDYLSPLGTEWAWGSLMDKTPKMWDTWVEAINWDPPYMKGNTVTMHSIADNQYYDFKFETWTEDGMGGGFSYKRYRVYPWIQPEVLTDTVAPGEFQNLDININVEGMPLGTYTAKMYVYSNDLTKKQIEIPFNITISDAPYLSTITDSIGFGNKSVGGTYTYPIKVVNSGSLPLNITDFVLSNPAFSVVESNLSIPAKGVDTINVQFTAADLQAYTGTLTINSNSYGHPSLVIPLTGTGVGAPNIGITPIAFDETIVAGQTVTKTITIENTGAFDLVWSGLVKSNIKSKLTFTKANYADYNLPANQDRITPNVILTRGNNQGIFNIAKESYYDRSSWPWISPKGTKWAWGNSKDLTPDKYDIWRQVIRSEGSTASMVGKPLSVFLEEDNMYIDLTFNSWTQGNNGGGFSYTRDAYTPSFPLELGTVTPSNSANVDLTINAGTLLAGVYNATIEILSNDPDQQVIQIPFKLTVTGTPVIAANDLAFGTVFTNDNKKLDLEISNTGTADLNISSITSNNGVFTFNSEAITIKGKEKVIVPVTFTPTSVGDTTGTLTINSNDAGTPLVINLSGSGALASIADITPANLEINVVAGSSNTGTITIANSGVSDLNWELMLNPVKTGGKVTFTKADYADWLLPANQDKISDSIIITRKSERAIFNIAKESEYDRNGSQLAPKGTKWSYNYTNESQPGDYTTFKSAIRNNISMRDLPGKPLSMYLVDEDKYIDVIFNSWTDGSSGGGFSYIRDAQPFSWWSNLSANNNSGIVAGAANTAVTFTADATNDVASTHYSEISITTNDPTHKTVIIPVKVTITGTPVIAANTLDFGLVDSTSSKTLELVVSNTGTDTLKISSFSSDNAAFAVISSAIAIPAKKTGKISVVFTPAISGSLAGILTINSDDAVNPAFTVNLTGTGAIAATLVVDKLPIEKSVAAGGTVDVTVSLQNTGEITLEGTSEIANSAPVHFSKANYADWTLAVNQDRVTNDVWITRANNRGLFNMKVEPGFNYDTYDSPLGTEWASGKTVENTPSNYSRWYDVYDRDPQSMIGNFMSMHDIVENRYFDIKWESWSQGDGNYGGSGGGFSYTRTEVPFWVNTLSDFGTIAGGASKDVTFKLDASNLKGGIYNTKLYIKTNDPASPVVEIPVKLTVTGAPVIAVPASLSFADQPIGGNETKNLVITNSGDSILSISGIAKTKAEFSFVATFPILINPGKSASIPVTFTPADAIQYDDVFTISSNDTSALSKDVTISGLGIGAPSIALTGNPISVKVISGSDGTAQLVIKNTGTTDLTWDIEGQSVTFTKANNADFTLAANQDRITDKVWITRKSSQSIFNIKQETGYVATSPEGTLWALGLTADVSQSDYKNWYITSGANPSGMVGKQASLYLVEDNKYFDIVFNSFAGGGSGGGFSYTRKEILPDWISFGSQSGTVAAAGESTVTINLLESGLDGTYTTTLALKSNDPTNPVINVPVTFTVSSLLLVNPVADVRKEQGFVSDEIEIDTVFSAGAASIKAVSSNKKAVTVEAVGDTLLKITEVGAGNAIITLIADDGNGKFTYDDFNYIVNAGPAVAGSIANVTKNVGFGFLDINLASLFTDINGDAISLGASSSNTSAVTVGITGTTLKVTEVAHGVSTITITAADGFAATPTSYTFTFRVNTFPTVSNAIADVVVNQGFASKTVDLTSVFADVDADALTYTVTSGTVSVATAAIIDKLLTLTEVGVGVSTITVTANDGNGGTVSDDFTIRVNSIPTVGNAIADVLVNQGFVTSTVDLTNTFADADADVLTLSVSSSATGVVTSSITNKVLTITEVGAGVSTITVTANDGNGGTVSEDFAFRVNTIPTVANALADILVNEGLVTKTVDLTNAFVDADADVLTLSVSSSATGVVTGSITNKVLTITEVGAGVSTITVTANDGKGGTVSDAFTFSINSIPTVSNAIANVLVAKGFGTKTFDLTNTFADADADALTYSISSSATGVVTGAVTDKVLTITEVGSGVSTITVTANDGRGGTVSDDFTFTVNSIPTISNAIADVVVNEGFGTKTFDLSNTFADANLDVLTLSVSSSATNVVTVSITNKILTVSAVGVGVSTITVVVNDGNGGTISDVFTFTVNKTIGIENIANLNISLYPNPTSGLLTISADRPFSGEVSIKVINLIGVEVLKKNITDAKELISLDLTSLNKGLYVLQIMNDSKVILSNKVVIK